jgi:hypothetical protein
LEAGPGLRARLMEPNSATESRNGSFAWGRSLRGIRKSIGRGSAEVLLPKTRQPAICRKYALPRPNSMFSRGVELRQFVVSPGFLNSQLSGWGLK